MDFCKEHWEQPFTFYCSTCKELICNECIVSHQSHTFCTISKMRVEEENNRFYMKNIEYLWKQLKCTATTVETLRKTESEIAEFYKELHDLLIQEEHKIKKQVISEVDKAAMLILDTIKEIQTTKHVIESMGLEIKFETSQESNNNNDDSSFSEQVEQMVTEESSSDEIANIKVIEEDINKLIDTIGQCSNLKSFLKTESLFPKSVGESDKPMDQKQLIECMGYIAQLKPTISIQLPIEYEVKFSEEARDSIVSSIPQLNDLYDKNRKFLIIHKSDGWIKLDLSNESIGKVGTPTIGSYYSLSVNGRDSLMGASSLYTFQDNNWKTQSLIKSISNIISSCHDYENNIFYIFYSEQLNFKSPLYYHLLKWNINDKSSNVSTLKFTPKSNTQPVFVDNSLYFYDISTKQIHLLDQEKYTVDLYYSLEKVISRKLHAAVYDNNGSIFVSTKKSIYKISVIDKTCTKISNLPCFIDKKTTIKMVCVNQPNSHIKGDVIYILNVDPEAIHCYHIESESWHLIKSSIKNIRSISVSF
ncbi:hypothetical protein PPL_03169 [Heterostelium album PN500]|uniref:B box-type domain-containing protein n=1 Tax=Heterostelium pallidum (strain ATCC 26659 / Pp 5 / PN500) TaxID=670386 RepID=D3B448_HETP5|nr:hypothetical protein PPL_03169 [Heterostelium album PN500]EFA84096.1 hypothetical protein PPL_03169 [Heterostelium album PN500]|eukprot:XP_020436213.1 hypothetical protein PPL_03169 [Heterostelium album PN500]